MSRERISQGVAALVVVAGILAATDPDLVPPLVAQYALLAGSIVGGIAGAFGLNTPPKGE